MAGDYAISAYGKTLPQISHEQSVNLLVFKYRFTKSWSFIFVIYLFQLKMGFILPLPQHSYFLQWCVF